MGKSVSKFATLLLISWILPATAFAVPLFFLPVTNDFFGFNKQYLLAVIATVALALYLIKNIIRRRIKLKLTPSTLSLLLLSAVFILSSLIQSPTPQVSLMGKTTLIVALTIIYVSVTSSAKNHSLVNITLGALILSAVLASLFSLGNLTGATTGLFSADWLKEKAVNPTGGLIPSLAFSLMLLPATFYLAVKSGRPLLKAALLCASAVLLVSSLSQINYLRSLPTAPILKLPLLVGWSIALDIFKNWRTALLGSGPDTFLSVFTQLKPAFLNQTDLWSVRFSSSSNELLELLTTVGLLGAFFWVTAIYKPLKKAFQNIKHKKGVSTQLVAAKLLTVSALIAALIVPAGATLTTVLFVSLILLNLSLEKDEKGASTANINLSGINPLILPVLLSVLAALGLAAFWLKAGKSYAAELASFKARSLLATNTTESYNLQIKAYQLNPQNAAYRVHFSQTSMALASEIAKQKDLSDEDKEKVTQLVQQSIREAKNATTLDPQNVIVWENLATIYTQIAGFVEGAPDWTVATYSQAISLDPANPALRLGLGGFFFNLGDYDQAARVFEQAVNIKPNWANAHYNLASALKAKKEYARALSEIKIVKDLLDPKSEDVQKVEGEVKELEKLAPTPTPTATPTATPTPPKSSL